MTHRVSALKQLSILLILYIVFQCSVTCSIGSLQALTLVLQEAFFIWSVILSMNWMLQTEKTLSLRIYTNSLLSFLIATLILEAFWYVHIYPDPEINWKLTGNETEVDPWFYILYVPVINFISCAFVLTLLMLLRYFKKTKQAGDP